MELALCQRYTFAILAGSEYLGHAVDTGNAVIPISCPCEMRVVPSMPSLLTSNGVLYAANGASYTAVVSGYGMTSSRSTVQLSINTGNGLAGAGTVTRWRPNSDFLVLAEL